MSRPVFPAAATTKGARAAPARLAAVLGLLLGLGTLATGPAAAADLTASGAVTWAQDRTNELTSEYLRQAYTLEWRRRFSQPIFYRLSLRYQADQGESEADGLRTDVRTRVIAPAAGLEYRLDEVGVTAAWRRNDEEQVDPSTGARVRRVVDRTSVSLLVRPFERGDGAVTGDRLAYEGTNLDTTDDRFGLSFRYTSPQLRITNENRVQHYADDRAGTSRIGIGPRLAASYDRGFGELLRLSTQYVLDYLRSEQTARSATPVAVPIDLEPAAGLTIVDDTPDLTGPLAAEPRLIDRVFDATTGVSLGPLAPSFQNLAVDLGRFAEADELRIHVRTSAGALVPFGGGVSWTLYTSQDGLRWFQVSGSAAAFDPGVSAWVVTFPVTSARFFKVVNFGVNTVETEVTELQAFVHQTFQPNETHVSSSVRQSLTLAATIRPWPKVQIGLLSQSNASAVTPYGGETRWTTDVSNALNATIGPRGPLLYDATATQTWSRQADGATVSSVSVGATARYQPIPQYQATGTARYHTDAVSGGGLAGTARARTYSGALRNDAVLLPTLRAFLGGGAMRQIIADGSTTDFLTASAGLSAALAEGLNLQLDGSLQRTISLRGDTTLQESVPIFQVLTYEVYRAELQYRVSTQLALTLRLGYSASGAGSGWNQTYRANWSPFPGGTVQLEFDYSEEIDPLSGRSFRRASASPRWVLNRHANLQLSYNMTQGTGALPVEQQNVYLTFSVRL